MFSKLFLKAPKPKRQPWYPELVEVPQVSDDKYEKERNDRLNGLLDYLRTEPAFDELKHYSVRRDDHDERCKLLLICAYAHIAVARIIKKKPLSPEALSEFSTLMDLAWAERKPEIRALIPVFEETCTLLH
jgi:hypothetical protein